MDLQEFNDNRLNLILKETKKQVKKILEPEYGFLESGAFQEEVNQLLDDCIVETLSNFTQGEQKSIVEYAAESCEEELGNWLRKKIQDEHKYSILDEMILYKNPKIAKGNSVSRMKSLMPIYSWLRYVGLDSDEEVFRYIFNNQTVQNITQKINWKNVDYDWLEQHLSENEKALFDTYLMIFNIDLSSNKNNDTSDESKRLTAKVIQYQSMPAGYQKEILFEEIYNENKRLLYKQVRRFLATGIDDDDLFQLASEGFLIAIKKFDPKRNCAFSTYAIWWIRQNIARNIDNSEKAIRIPTYLEEKARRLKKTLANYEQQSLPIPSDEIISQETGLSLNQLKTIRQIPSVSTSLNSLVGDEDDSELGLFFPDETSTKFVERIEENDIRKKILKLFDEMKLSERDKDIMIRRFGLNGEEEETLNSIGKRHGITRERIRQIQSKIINKLRTPYYAKKIAEITHVNLDESLLNLEGYLSKEQKGMVNKMKRNTKGFSPLFIEKGFTEEEIKRAFLTMTEKQKEVAYARWGKELGEQKQPENSEEKKLQAAVFPQVIKPMIIKMLYYRDYGRFPSRGSSTKKYHNQLNEMRQNSRKIGSTERKNSAVETRQISDEELKKLEILQQSKKSAMQNARESSLTINPVDLMDAPKEEITIEDSQEQSKEIPNCVFTNCTIEQLTKLKQLLKSTAFTKMYQRLPLPETMVLASIFCLEKTPTEISSYMGISPEQVNQAFDSAIEHLEVCLNEMLPSSTSMFNTSQSNLIEMQKKIAPPSQKNH